jgi:uncharacterized protein
VTSFAASLISLVSSALAPYSAVGDGLRVAVKVTPKASRDRIGDIFTDADGRKLLKISVTAAPDRGKANEAVIRLLAKAWAVPKTSIKVTSGATDRHKILQVTGNAPGLETRLRDWLDGRDG